MKQALWIIAGWVRRPRALVIPSKVLALYFAEHPTPEMVARCRRP